MIYAINYADRKYKNAQRLNTKTAYFYGADKVIQYGEKDIDENFREKNRRILECPRGNGYWLWKPYIIYKTLKSMNVNDYLIYTDSGMAYINKIEYLISSMEKDGTDIMVFEIEHAEKCYTKRDAFVLMHCDQKDFSETRQRCGGLLCFKKTENTIRFVKEWLEYAQDERIITDNPNMMGKTNYVEFVDHRHDQSIISLLSKKYNIHPFRDASQYGNDMNYSEEILRRSQYPQIFDLHRSTDVSPSLIIHYLGLDKCWAEFKRRHKYLGRLIK